MALDLLNTSHTLFTSESVTEGHPDKLADQISDAILDACLAQDPRSRVAAEVATKTGYVLIFGEITTQAQINFDDIARDVVRSVGYDSSEKGLDADTMAVLVSISRQSPDIAQGVDRSLEARQRLTDEEVARLGAGDQGMMFGFACTETPTYMPMPIYLAHRLTRRLAEVRKQGVLPFLWPDGKSQVTVEYEYGRPKRVRTVLVSAQHSPEVTLETLREAIIEEVIKPVIPPELLQGDVRYLVNPTGRFVIGGPKGDAGLTGRKIMVDTYGGMARHGGGAFSGKDPTKVDRSGAYAARWVAKNIVAAGLAERCEVQVAYAIGVAEPVSLHIETFGTNKIPVEKIEALVRKHFDLRPGAIIRDLDLLRPIYRQVAAYGHFGREDLDLPWERTDKAEVLRAEAGL